MTHPEAPKLVDAFVARYAPGIELADDTQLFALGILDSVSLVHLVGELEDAYDIDIADEELIPANFGTRAAIDQFIAGKQAS